MSRYWSLTRHAFVVVSALLLIAACAAPAAPAATETEAPTEAATETEAPVVPTIEVAPSDDCVFIDDQQQIVVESCDAKAAERSFACNDVVPLKGDIAYNINDGSKPIGWTLGVNFSDASLGTAGPLGCLRLYLRDDGAAAYVPIDNGGILFDTCTASATVPITGEMAQYCTPGAPDNSRAISCKVNLAGWLQEPDLIDYIDTITTVARPLIHDFASVPDSIHHYPNFAMVAKAKWENNCDLVKAVLPVIHYVAPAAPTAQPSLDLVSESSGDDRLRFAASCPEEQPAWYDVGQTHRLWYDIAEDAATSASVLTYVHQLETAAAEVCNPGAGDAPVDFWIGEAELWIGHDPATDESFMGDLDGILIDPYDSKPPVASIND